MYYEHFGLNYPPFKITPNTQLFYAGGNRGLTLEALLYAIKNGEGIVKVVGEVGSGKTMLCRMLEETLPKHIEIVYIANPRLSPEMILHAIALEMSLPVTSEHNRLQVMHLLHSRLLEKHGNNQQVVVFVEEAQGMPLATLEEIRLLSNLETNRHKLLQIVLFGQPELDIHLSVSSIRQLKERITHSFYLTGLSAKHVREYLHFRMHAVGYRGPPVFSAAAVRLLTRVSKGLIRRVNILADKALLAAFADNVHLVRPKHVRLAARDSGFGYPWIPTSVLVVGLVMIFLLAVWFSLYREQFTPLLTQVVEKQPILPIVVEKAVVSLPATKVSPPPLSLEQRLLATEQWLAKVSGQHYTLQVMRTKVENTEDLKRLLQKAEIYPLLADLYIYRVKHNEQDYWEIVYAEFADADNAIAAIATLPEMLKQNKPFLRKIATLQGN
jgi:type II secretory pathway predicted ATPase ExeA